MCPKSLDLKANYLLESPCWVRYGIVRIQLGQLENLLNKKARQNGLLPFDGL